MSGAQPRAPARSALPAALRAGFGRGAQYSGSASRKLHCGSASRKLHRGSASRNSIAALRAENSLRFCEPELHRSPASRKFIAALRAGTSSRPCGPKLHRGPAGRKFHAGLRAGYLLAHGRIFQYFIVTSLRAGQVMGFCPLLRRVHSNRVPQILLRRRAVSFNPLRKPWSSARDAAG